MYARFDDCRSYGLSEMELNARVEAKNDQSQDHTRQCQGHKMVSVFESLLVYARFDHSRS